MPGEPAPLDAVRPGVPAALAGVARRLLAKRPRDRYQSPAELADALAGFLAGGAPAAHGQEEESTGADVSGQTSVHEAPSPTLPDRA